MYADPRSPHYSQPPVAYGLPVAHHNAPPRRDPEYDPHTASLRAYPRPYPPRPRPPSAAASVRPLSGPHAPAHKHKPWKKTFSDFRIKAISIGTFHSDEYQPNKDDRDSRLRIYFRSHADSRPTAPGLDPDRISISLFRGRARIIIPSDRISRIAFHRDRGHVVIDCDGWAAFEQLTDDISHSYHPQFAIVTTDPTNGQLALAKKIEIWLNKENQLTEPKWTRGNLRDNIESTSRFRRLIEILDGDAPPTFEGIVSAWAKESGSGTKSIGLKSDRLMWKESLNTPHKLWDLFHFAFHRNSDLAASLETLVAMTKHYISKAGPDTDHQVLMSQVKELLFLLPDSVLRAALNDMFHESLELEARKNKERMTLLHDLDRSGD
ncbi:hypothetical protein NEOLI_000328 [Neolecta irregularis DAH-3]|uniref:Uncharacterized protein n=1 Tax=Neolecta irregularis (strain DAH-3) TaxID=1198029 RepID=A0A1U7LVK8_NEOID|nr:hypothetical protein NEOLI_000328 [Neolecta irregularis DAH-3]|eukprot:OLL26697.1 hypothetical protein NEOLI_000328 [Neolecta irregularis DAH-3]